MYCLDTNIFVAILRGEGELLQRVQYLFNAGTKFYISSISLCELYRGAYGHAKAKEKVTQLNHLLSYFKILDIDILACHHYGQIFNFLRKSGKTVSQFDLLIAVSVKANDLILVTRDKKDFENMGIRIEMW